MADVDTVSPVTYYAHTDHLGRPVKLTNSAKSAVWDAVWLPFGGAHSITGSLTHEHRLPGQWYQLEAGLHYNWHRHYDPTIGRYTQPDPLGFVDGPSQYAYARSGPQMYVDPDGRNSTAIGVGIGLGIGGPGGAAVGAAVGTAIGVYMCYRALGGGGSGSGSSSSSGGDGRGPLDRCLDAAATGSSAIWEGFCAGLPKGLGTAVAGGKPKARTSCRQKTHSTEQEKKNWCLNQFGNH